MGGVLLVLGAVLAVIILGREEPRAVTLDEVRQRLATSTLPADGTTPGATPGSTPGTTTGDENRLPAAGIYLFEGEGTEDTSLPPLVEHQGPEMPATVTWTDPGCFTFRIDYNTNHWQSWDLCATEEGLVEHGGISFSRRDFTFGVIDSESVFVCDPVAWWLPAGATTGDRAPGSCVGTSNTIGGETTAAGPTTYEGIEEVTVGGETVEAHHLYTERTLTGAQVGLETFHVWLRLEDNLILQADRTVDVATDTPIGAVDYTETSSWTLSDLEPA